MQQLQSPARLTACLPAAVPAACCVRLVSLLAAAVGRAVPVSCFGLLGVTLLCLHQLLLSAGGWTEFVLHSPRGPSFLAHNREGILSVSGYLALFLIAAQAGAALSTQASNLTRRCAITMVRTRTAAQHSVRLSCCS